MTNIDAFESARRKAGNGRAQIVWKNAAGDFFVGARSPKTLKRALLAVGTAGRFSMIDTAGRGHVINWFMGCRMIRNARYGC